MKKLLFLIIFCIALIGCNSSNSNKNTANVNSINSNKINTTEANPEPETKRKQVDNETEKAIRDFVAKHYLGWTIKGVEGGFSSCDEDSNAPCNLLITKGNFEKVVSVMVKVFVDKDDQPILKVYEARPIDLSQTKIEKIKEAERENILENLTTDDISDDLKTEIYQKEEKEMREADEESRLGDP